MTCQPNSLCTGSRSSRARARPQLRRTPARTSRPPPDRGFPVGTRLRVDRDILREVLEGLLRRPRRRDLLVDILCLGLGGDEDVQRFDRREAKDLVLVDLLELLVTEPSSATAPCTAWKSSTSLARSSRWVRVRSSFSSSPSTVSAVSCSSRFAMMSSTSDALTVTSFARVVRDQPTLDHVAERETVAHRFLRLALGAARRTPAGSGRRGT